MEKQKESLFGPMDLTRGTCWKTILIFSLPVILSYLLQQVYSISDAAIVGQTLTAQEVAGVNDTSSLVFIFLQFAFGVSAGFCVVTSCQVGARNQAGVRVDQRDPGQCRGISRRVYLLLHHLRGHRGPAVL